jgi:hypothetical protein
MLMKQGQIHKITDVIDSDSAQLIAEELGHTVRRVAESETTLALRIASSSEVLPWSTWPMMVTTGGRGWV